MAKSWRMLEGQDGRSLLLPNQRRSSEYAPCAAFTSTKLLIYRESRAGRRLYTSFNCDTHWLHAVFWSVQLEGSSSSKTKIQYWFQGLYNDAYHFRISNGMSKRIRLGVRHWNTDLRRKKYRSSVGHKRKLSRHIIWHPIYHATV